jgi:hypothetical protein
MINNLKIENYSATAGDTDLNTTSSFMIPVLQTSGQSFDNPIVYGPVPSDTGAGDTNYGYLYNWAAATAGETPASMPGDGTHNDIAPNSICPKGWRLPTGGPSGEYRALYNSMSSGFQFDGAFNGVFAGLWKGNFIDQMGGAALWASSTNFNGGFIAHGFFSFYPNSVYPESEDDRNAGLAVRCLVD